MAAAGTGNGNGTGSGVGTGLSPAGGCAGAAKSGEERLKEMEAEMAL